MSIDGDAQQAYERLLRDVNAALRDCIGAHGPITAEWIGSASKRIVAQIRQSAKVAALGTRRQINGD